MPTLAPAHPTHPTCASLPCSPACYKLSAGAAYPCIRRKLEQREQGYAPRLRAWATAFPPEQLYVLQASSEGGVGGGCQWGGGRGALRAQRRGGGASDVHLPRARARVTLAGAPATSGLHGPCA